MVAVRIDEQIFSSQARGGIGFYFSNLIREFLSRPELGVEIVGLARFTVTAQMIEWGYAHPFPLQMVGRRQILSTLNRAAAALDPQPDVEHPSYYFKKALSRRRPNVVTVYDMAPELFPEMFPTRNPHLHKMENIRQADVVVCISETTRRDLERIAPPLRAEVIVSPLAVGPPFTDHTISEHSRRDNRDELPYVLYVGARYVYKGFDTFIAAVGKVVKERNLRVIIAGGGSVTPGEKRMLASAGLADAWTHVSPDDHQLRALYREAAVFVLPSLYEGFGLPVLEAMASGCPVVVSDAPALLEVTAGSTATFERGDVDGLVKEIESILGSPARARQLAAAGLSRVDAFSWRHTAEQTAVAYQLALTRRRS